MITRKELEQLQSLVKVPALSILLPTHRTSPDNRQDPIRVKNLVSEAAERLSEEFSKRDLELLLQRLESLVNDINYPHTLDGLALFVSHDFAKRYYLPFTVPERVVIDQTFATRDLIYGMHREQRYWVLLLSQASTRLLAGTGETLEEVEDENFPMQMTGPGATEALPYSADSAYIDDRQRRFFQRVDEVLMAYNKYEKLPLIVGGVDRQVSFFREMSQVADTIAGTLGGNYDKTSLSELTVPVWELVQAIRQAQQEDALRQLDAAMSSRSVASTLGEVWRFAHEGRGKLLLVEKNYHVPAVLDEQGRFQQVEQVGGVAVMDDAVDEVIETVLAKGGNVALVEDGTLAMYQRIALTLRY